MNDVFSTFTFMKITSINTKKWGVVHWLKSLWDFFNEIGSLHINDFTLVEVISWVKAHYSDSFWGVTLYYFPRMCMFECIPLQTFERFSQYFFILC